MDELFNGMFTNADGQVSARDLTENEKVKFLVDVPISFFPRHDLLG